MGDFIDIHKLDKYYKNKLNSIKNDTALSPRNKSIILRYLKESELGKTIKKGQKKQIGAGRNMQSASFLNMMAKDWFKKDIDTVADRDMERFITELNNGKIKNSRGTAYSSETKSNIKKFIRKFYKWLIGNGVTYPPLVDWIDTSKKDAQIYAIPSLDKGVWWIVELIPDIRRKALIWCCFDSGFREGEILNCRIEDVEKNSDGIYYITCKHSKTKPRTVSLPYSSELLDRWLSQHPDKDNPKAQLWQTSRVMFYKTVRLYGQKAHKKNVTVHMIRHTSATFWAPKLDRVSFCKRFGWSYNSSSPDRYIDFAKVTENKIVDIVKAEKYDELKKELETQKVEKIQMQEQLRAMQEQQKRLMEAVELTKLYEKLRKKKS